jgi:hypothetical protein
MANQLKLGRYLATAKAQEQRLAFLLAAAEGDGDVSSLFALADWYVEHGADREAADVRRCVERYASQKRRTVKGETWLAWYARYQLGVLADSLTRQETAFPGYVYRGSYPMLHDGLVCDDGSLEAAIRLRGYVPTLCRTRKRQERLGRILEVLGHKVFWRD